MSDRTPADVIAGTQVPVRLAHELAEAIYGSFNCYPSDREAGALLDEALAAVGYQVAPIPDDDIQAEVAEVCDRLKRLDGLLAADRTYDASALRRYLRKAPDLLAAAYLDGQPQDRPATCPKCGSHDPAVRGEVMAEPSRSGVDSTSLCPDQWHVGGSGDTR